MIELDEYRLLKSQVGALQECIDLCRNQYFIRVQHFCSAFWYIKMKHYHNGRELTVWWEPGVYRIKKNSQLLKEVKFPNEIDAQGENTPKQVY